MDDWPRAQLQQLAPTVDEAASKRLFDERRAGAPEGWRFLAAAAAIVIVGAGSLVLFGLAGGDGGLDVAEDEASASTVPATLDEPDFEVIERGGSRTSERTLAAAVTTDQLIELLGDRFGAASSVDFRRQIVVAIALPRDVCNPQLTGFEVNGRIVTPNFEASSDGCPATTAPLPEPRFRATWFVAIDRVELSPSFTLRLPPEPVTGDGEMLLDVQVPPADSVPAPPTFEVLDVQVGADQPGNLRSAIDRTQLEALWVDARLDGEVPTVDFARQMVISFSTYGTGRCGEEFDGFDTAERVWTPRFGIRPTASQPCTTVAIPSTYVVAVDREAATPEFTLRLLDSYLEDPPGERRLRVDVPLLPDENPAPSSTPPSGPPNTDPVPAPPVDSFEVLAVQAGMDMGVLRSAVDIEELARLWADGRLEGQLPELDFDRWIVVSIAIPDDACPPTLGEFDVTDGAIWTAVFVETANECIEPLIPKTYVVAIDRSSVSPRFTLRLPGDPTFDFEEQRLEIKVPDAGDPPAVTEPVPENVDDPESVVPLPDRGDAVSLIADDGTPWWIVHHEDGTASALPAVTRISNTLGVESLAVDERGAIVRWRPNARRFEAGALAFDEYGRALTTGRDDDLADYTAEIRGDTVIVRPSGVDRVPADPVRPSTRSTPEQGVEPILPEVRSLPADLDAGWSQIDATLVSHIGTWSICDVDVSDPVPDLATCPEEALIATGLEGGHDEGYTNWYFGPLVMHVDRSGAIDLIVTTGGYASSVDE